MNFDFTKNLDLNQIIDILKNMTLIIPLESYDLKKETPFKKETIRRLGFLRRYDNIWINYYTNNIIEVCVNVKTKDKNKVFTSLIKYDSSKNQLMDQLLYNYEFGKCEDGDHHIYKLDLNNPCKNKEHIHYNGDILAHKTFEQTRGYNETNFDKGKESIEVFNTNNYINRNLNLIEFQKIKNTNNTIQLNLNYYFSESELESKKNKELKLSWPNNGRRSMGDWMQMKLDFEDIKTKILELNIDINDNVISFLYCGHGFTYGYNSESLNSLTFFKNYRVQNHDSIIYDEEYNDPSYGDILNSREYKNNVSLGTVIYNKIKEEVR